MEHIFYLSHLHLFPVIHRLCSAFQTAPVVVKIQIVEDFNNTCPIVVLEGLSSIYKEITKLNQTSSLPPGTHFKSLCSNFRKSIHFPQKTAFFIFYISKVLCSIISSPDHPFWVLKHETTKIFIRISFHFKSRWPGFTVNGVRPIRPSQERQSTFPKRE